MNYIELSNGKVGYVEDINNQQFINDLERNNLTYKIITQQEYDTQIIINTIPLELLSKITKRKKIGEGNE